MADLLELPKVPRSTGDVKRLGGKVIGVTLLLLVIAAGVGVFVWLRPHIAKIPGAGRVINAGAGLTTAATGAAFDQFGTQVA